MKRLGGLDLARGLACLGMIEAHAYDAYVDAPHRVTAAFALTRFIALLPLPLFLTLAGMGVALRVQRGLERGRRPATCAESWCGADSGWCWPATRSTSSTA
jgi:uncharacterized membrane protein